MSGDFEFDKSLERLIASMSSEGMREVFSDDKASLFFSQLIRLRMELSSIYYTFLADYIPIAEKSCLEMKESYSKSEYTDLLKIDDELIMDSLYEIVRLGYIALSHKYESYVKGVIKAYDDYYSDFWTDNLSLNEFINKKFGLNLVSEKHITHYNHKFNWVANCTKHYNGFPLKNDPPLVFKSLNPNTKICLEPKEFEVDGEMLLKFCDELPRYLQTLSAFKMEENDRIMDLESFQEYEKQTAKFVEHLKGFNS